MRKKNKKIKKPPGRAVDVQVLEAETALLEDQRCLPTLKPRVDFSMLLLTFVTSAGCLALARGRPAADANAFLVSVRVVGKAGEDRCATSL